MVMCDTSRCPLLCEVNVIDVKLCLYSVTVQYMPEKSFLHDYAIVRISGLHESPCHEEVRRVKV